MSNVVDRPPVYDSKESYGMKGWFQTIYNIFKGITKIDSNLLFDLAKGITNSTGATIYTGPAGNTWTIKPGSAGGSNILTLYKADGTTATLNFGQSSTQVESLLDLSINNGDNTNGQIKFPASQNASADANTLDDYEEGTWTPVVTPSTGVITSYTAVGSYTKIGRQVAIQVTISITNNGTGAGGISFTTPFTQIATYSASLFGRETQTTGASLNGFVDSSSSSGNVWKYDNTYPGGTNYTLRLSGIIFV